MTAGEIAKAMLRTGQISAKDAATVVEHCPWRGEEFKIDQSAVFDLESERFLVMVDRTPDAGQYRIKGCRFVFSAHDAGRRRFVSYGIASVGVSVRGIQAELRS